MSRCPLAVAPVPLAIPTLGLEALLRCRVRSSRTPLPANRSPLLPWAWFPSRALAGPRGPTRCVSTSARALSLRRRGYAVASASARPLRRTRLHRHLFSGHARARSRLRLAEASRSVCPGRSVCISEEMRTLLGFVTSKNSTASRRGIGQLIGNLPSVAGDYCRGRANSDPTIERHLSRKRGGSGFPPAWRPHRGP